MSANPYAAPAVDVEPLPALGDETEALAIRRAHITHEVSLKAIGTLWILGGLLMLIGAAGIVIPLVGGEMEGIGMIAGFVLIYAVLGSLSLWCGVDMRRLNPRARIGGSILAATALLGVPIGTLFGIYALVLMHGKKGQVVFGPDYARIVELTPQVKHKTSIVVWVLLGLVVLAVLAGLLSAAFA